MEQDIINKTIDRKTVDSKAESLLLSVYEDIEKINLPVDLSKILKKQNIKLEEGIFTNKNIIGSSHKDGERVIRVSNDSSYKEKVFTIGHELGHMFLQSDRKQDVFIRDRLYQLDKEERMDEIEANLFATALLMPEKLVVKYWRLTHDRDTLSKIFGVLPLVTDYRLKTLALT